MPAVLLPGGWGGFQSPKCQIEAETGAAAIGAFHSESLRPLGYPWWPWKGWYRTQNSLNIWICALESAKNLRIPNFLLPKKNPKARDLLWNFVQAPDEVYLGDESKKSPSRKAAWTGIIETRMAVVRACELSLVALKMVKFPLLRLVCDHPDEGSDPLHPDMFKSKMRKKL